ncbi:sigma-70 family RNA polymerase sigma factor [Sporosarcina koreensis]|uniref:sigma-70 family RNA polymerase sigma factor n=1 Tax=Sporosarcina koreensis TaxID=334735 RepID=UPI0009E5D72E|nr:sigma-70 family RNA polymerase sigma factor [Sporosarcina koreensis]
MFKIEEGGSFVMTKKEKFKRVEQFLIENQNAHYRLAYSYVKNKEDALDIVQDSIFKALRSIDRLDDLKYLKTWFYRILVNTSIDFIRKHQRMMVMDEETLDGYLPSTEDAQADMDLRRALDALTAYEKSLLLLRFFEDLKIDEVAAVLGENVNTVKTKLYRTVKKLRIEIGEGT